ncbi:GntR family transcriptional regulator [Microbispora corallina]|uniref:GntR family transcriptional regulator n=1 Tax=Microbispora corallina TaxID=83302 RepID=A0ABQ4G5K5_9ACTN|nr:GntR family transcriptional regulator [Microbispora corallina]GIH42322.1 GntR family transcriptional regulator [Microbispora corallina]
MARPEPIRLRRSTLGDDVYETLRALILEHSMRPGDRVNIDALARELDVSPTPVREALARLESDGLVRKRPLAGYTVSPLLTPAEFTQMFEMRLLLECAAARWAAERATSEQREAIAMEAATSLTPEADDPDGRGWHAAFTTHDARFHDLVAEASGNPLLRDGLERLHVHLHLHRRYFPYAHAGTTVEEHRRVAAAIGAGRPEEAEEAMRAHLSRARERQLPAFD